MNVSSRCDSSHRDEFYDVLFEIVTPMSSNILFIRAGFRQIFVICSQVPIKLYCSRLLAWLPYSIASCSSSSSSSTRYYHLDVT